MHPFLNKGMKRATTIDEQIALLKSRGMIISDESKAREVLSDIGYFRLCTYFFPFETTYPQDHHRTHQYKPGTKFEDGVALYYFDVDIRRIMQNYLARIEVAVRTAIVYEISNYYKTNPTWFVDSSLVRSNHIAYFNSNIYTLKFKNDHPVIRRHHQRYRRDAYAPAWKTLEYMTFGAVLILFNSIISVDARLLVTQRFNISTPRLFENYFTHICTARNICAHGSALFDVRLNTAIADGPAGVLSATGDKQNLQGVFTIIYFVLTQISQNRAADFKREIYATFNQLRKYNPSLYAQIVQISGYKEEFFKKKCKIFACFKKK